MTRIPDSSALIAAEVAYVGSFLREPKYKRDKDFFSLRTSVVNPADLNDPVVGAALEAVIRLYHQNEVPTIDNAAHIMLTEGLVTPEDIGISGEEQTWQKLAGLLDYCAERGAKSLKDFRVRERAIRENWRNQSLSAKQLEKFLDNARRQSGSSLELAIALRQYADSLIGETEVVSQTADWEKQKELFKEIPERQKALIGKPRFTFPPHWQLNSLIPVLRPGEKIVLSGGTGDGKSALCMQFAEWAAISGKNVLVVHMEDDDDIILMRQTVRWIGGTLEELEKGDPKGKMAQMVALRERWMQGGGGITYKYLAGHSIPLIVEQIKETARDMESQGKHLDVVVMDYFQKADFDTNIKSGQNYVNVANAGAELLKITAQRLSLVLMVVSQETSDGNGGKHTAWTKALEQKPQVYISLTRHAIKREDDEEWVNMLVGTAIRRVPIAKVGERSCWLQVDVKKANQSRQGRIWLFFEGPRFRAFDPKFMEEVESGARNEFDVPILTPADDAFFKRTDLLLESYRQARKQFIKPDERKLE